jgi:Tol biopolymer transport system component
VGRLEELRQFDRVPALSPDGAFAAVSERTEDQWDVWTVDLKSGARKRLTADGFARNATWAPDGKSIIYTSFTPGAPPALKRVAADGSGLLEDLGPGRDASVTRDGKAVFYWRDFDLFHRPLGGGAEVPFLAGADADIAPRPSPDGRFVAYLRMERTTLDTALFVKPFAGGEAVGLKTRTRTYRWSSDGRKLFVADEDTVVTEVDVQAEPRFRIGVPRKLFSLRPLGTSGAYPGFDVSSDGQRFLTVQSEPEAAIQRVVVVLDFRPGK